MRRRALLGGGKEKLPLIIRVDTTKSGATPSDTFRIPTTTAETYRYKVDWGDGVVTSNHTGNAEHTYATGGIYDIKIYGKFPKIHFNNEGDRQKLLKVLDWGEINYSTNQTAAFNGCVNLEFIATDTLNSWYNNIVNGNNMFLRNSLTSLPNNMELPLLTNGNNMFVDNSLTSLPDGMTLSNLTNGNNMFLRNSLTSLPINMELPLLTSGVRMFDGNSLTSLPVGMELPLLTNGTNMFYDNSLTSLPDGMTLASLTNGYAMFQFNSLTSLPDGITLANLTDGTNMFHSNTINTVRYSQLLIDMATLNPNNDVIFHAGNSKYNKTAVEARQLLIARGWTITDGGLE